MAIPGGHPLRETLIETFRRDARERFVGVLLSVPNVKSRSNIARKIPS